MFHKIIIAFLIVCYSFVALADEVLIIKNVKVSASDKNASLARNIAIEKGQIRSFAELVKLYYPDASDRATKFSDAQIFNTVEGFELLEEKRSASNYFAKMNVKFSRKQVDKLMSGLGANFSTKAVKQEEVIIRSEPEIESVPVMVAAPAMDTLVVPVFESNEMLYWFDDENIWLNFWQEKLKHVTSNQFTLPLGDLEDISLLNKNILNKNIIDLSSLFERSGVNNIALLKLKLIDHDNQQHYILSVDYINRFSHAWQQYTFSGSGNAKDSKTSMSEYYQEMLKFQFNASQSFADSLATIAPQSIIVDFPIKQILDWSALEQILTSQKYITNVELERINFNNYRFSLTYNIKFEKLHELLNRYNFILQESQDGRYALIKGEYNAEY
jgi:hypothetical protein